MLKRFTIGLLIAGLMFSSSLPGMETPVSAASLNSTDLNAPYGKFIIEDSQYYYYLHDYSYRGGSVYRMKKNDPSSNKAILLHYVRGLTLIDGWLYFFKSGTSMSAIGEKSIMDEPGFYKMKTDGTGITAIKRNVFAASFTIIDKFIYYINDSGQTMRMTLNGSKTVQILKGVKVSELFISNGWIYYTSVVKGKITLNKSKIDSSKSQIIATTDVYNMSVLGDWIYYKDTMSGNKMYRIRTDGTNLTKLGIGEDMLVSSDGIYYVYYDKYNSYLYGMERYINYMKHDGSGSKRISMVESSYGFNALNNKIFYRGLESTSQLSMISKDGKSWSYMNDKPINAYSTTQILEMNNKGIPYKIDASNKKVQNIEQSVVKARVILKKIIEPEMTDTDKLKAVHDYIVLNTEYDYENYTKDTVPEESYTEYGVLFKGVAVCDGYAKATKLFLDLLGIENYYVAGRILDGELHAWNVVKIDGKYVHVDTTWGDPVPNRPGEVDYKYYMVTDKFMNNNREWSSGQAPAAI